MSNATACRRCNNEGMVSHKHIAGGMCFACGRMPGGVEATPVQRAAARERLILDIATLLRRAEQEKAEGTLGEWWADVTTDESICLRAKIALGPADVGARARAAFARMGLAL